MKDVIFLHTSRDVYSANECIGDTMTVGELINKLRHYDEDTPIMFCNDNGYTYGYITDGRFADASIKTANDERREELEEAIDDLEWEINEEKHEWDDELATLKWHLENAQEGDDDYLTDEQYREEVDNTNTMYIDRIKELREGIAEIKKELAELSDEE